MNLLSINLIIHRSLKWDIDKFWKIGRISWCSTSLRNIKKSSKKLKRLNNPKKTIKVCRNRSRGCLIKSKKLKDRKKVTKLLRTWTSLPCCKLQDLLKRSTPRTLRHLQRVWLNFRDSQVAGVLYPCFASILKTRISPGEFQRCKN